MNCIALLHTSSFFRTVTPLGVLLSYHKAEAELTATQDTSKRGLPSYFTYKISAGFKLLMSQHCAQINYSTFLMFPDYRVQVCLLFQVSSQFHSNILILLSAFCNELQTTQASELWGSNSWGKSLPWRKENKRQIKTNKTKQEWVYQVTYHTLGVAFLLPLQKAKFDVFAVTKKSLIFQPMYSV